MKKTCSNLRETKKPITIKLFSERKEQLDNLMDCWDFETKEFVRGFLKPHLENDRKRPTLRDKFIKKDGSFQFLKNPEIFKNWEERFKITGEKNARRAFNKIIKKELTYYDTAYLVNRLDRALTDIVIPEEVVDTVHNVYVSHLKKEMIDAKGVPKKSFILVIGPTGSGKTHTIKGAIEQGIFNSEINIKKDYAEEKRRILEDQPLFAIWWKTIPELEALEKEEELIKKIERYRFLSKLPLLKKCAQEKLKKLEQKLDGVEREYESLKIDYNTISPHQIQTMWYGQTGKNFKDAMGDSDVPTIRHIIEAQGVLRKPDSGGQSSDIQSVTLAATVNEIMDEINDGKRDCILIADTHSPEDIASDIYRRFDEQGIIIDISKYWIRKPELEKLINLEAEKKNITLEQELSKQITDKVYNIFNKKSLIITPAYVRKLVSAVIEKKGNLELEYFDDVLLIRQAFENVAMNSHGDLYKKIVKRPKIEEGYAWEDYIGNVKGDILEMVTSTLLYEGEDKGVVLTGPPGSGKTFLAQVIGATHPEISYISVKLDDLQEERMGLEGIIQKIDGVYTIAKMIAPSLIVINEGEAIIKQRGEQGSNPYDKVTNKFLDILDGEESIKGTFTIVTTNLFENLDQAATRPGRLKVLAVEGKLAKDEVYRIIKKELGQEPRDEEVTYDKIYTVAKSINNVPAGYVNFVRKLKNLRKTDLNVIKTYKQIFKEEKMTELKEFIKYNAKSLIRILEALEADPKIIGQAKKDVVVLFKNEKLIYELINNINKQEDYLLKKSHLTNARDDILKNPSKKALKGLDEFLSEELSIEPQVGKIVGAAYGNNIGLLVPINTNLIFKADGDEDIIVTGVTKGSALQQIDYTEMTTQSAREALTLNIHYFQNLFSEDEHLKHLDSAVIIGSLLKTRTIHHQMESVNYMGGGPSAGFALSINTLSVLLNIPVYNDFGITGAPGTRGVSKDKAGSSIMIGGEDKKTERVLMDLKRMYVPKKNYHTIHTDLHEAYWNDGKIVIPVGDYREIIPEVLYFGKEHDQKLQTLIDRRIEYNKKTIFTPEDELKKEKGEILKLEKALKEHAEFEIMRRLVAINNFYRDPKKDELISLSSMFEKYSPIK